MPWTKKYHSCLSFFGSATTMILSLRAWVFPSRILAIPIEIRYLKARIIKTIDQNNNKKSKTVIIPLKIGSVFEVISDKNTFFYRFSNRIIHVLKSASEFESVFEAKNLQKSQFSLQTLRTGWICLSNISGVFRWTLYEVFVLCCVFSLL